MKRILLVLAVVVGVSLAGSFSAQAAGDAAKGEAVFMRTCKKCHGADGSGVPAIARAFKVEMIPLASEEIQKKTDDELKTIITEGFQKMKKVPGLSDQDVQDVIAYVRTLAKKDESKEEKKEQ